MHATPLANLIYTAAISIESRRDHESVLPMEVAFGI